MHGNGNLAVCTDFDSLRMVVSVKTKRFGDIAHPYPGLPPTYASSVDRNLGAYGAPAGRQYFCSMVHFGVWCSQQCVPQPV